MEQMQARAQASQISRNTTVARAFSRKGSMQSPVSCWQYHKGHPPSTIQTVPATPLAPSSFQGFRATELLGSTLEVDLSTSRGGNTGSEAACGQQFFETLRGDDATWHRSFIKKQQY